MFLNLLNFRLFRIPKNSAIIIFQGGLGNQMFQYFLGIELQKKYNKDVFYYDIRNSYKTNHSSNLEKLFDLKLKKLNIKNVNLIIRFIFLSPLFLKINNFIFQKFSFRILPNFYFDDISIPLNLKEIKDNKNILIFFGTWHNLINKYEYLSKSKNLIFKNNIYVPKSFDFNKKFISLHVRRGDYLNYKSKKLHGNLDFSYYLKATYFLRNKFGNLPVLLFSDDPKWLKENLLNSIPNSYLISSGNLSPESDFLIMSKGNYFILSNSTFSWLAAFFSKDKDKFIVIPKFWFNGKEIKSEYIYKEWNYKLI